MPATTESLAQDLRHALFVATRRIKVERGAAALPDPQYTALVLLEKHGPMTPGQLAEAERVQPPSMTRTVGCLAGLGFVIKAEHPDDGRQVLVTLTQAGHAELEETRRRRNAWLTARLDAMGDDDHACLERAAEILRGLAAS